MTFTTFSLSTLPLNTRAARAQPVLTTTTTSMSSFAAIPILGYSVLALIFSYIVQRLIRIVNFRNVLFRSSAASSSSSLETLPTSNAVPSDNKKSRIPLPSWDLTPFKRTTANAYRKASALVLPSRGNSVELLPTHVASPPPTAALVDYGVYAEQPTSSAGQNTFQVPVTPLPFPASASTPPLTSSPTPSTASTTSPRTPSPAHHSPFSIPLRVPLPTPFSLFPGPYVPLQPQPQQNAVKGIITPANRPRTPSPPFQHPLATTPPPTTAHRRSKSLGGVPVRKIANSRLGLGYVFPHDASAAVFPHAEVEMRDLYRGQVKSKGKDAPLIDFSSSEEEEEEEEGDDEDVGVFGRKSGRSADSLVPGGPLEMVALPLVDLSDTTRRGEAKEDVFGFKQGVIMSRTGHGRRSIGGGDAELLPENKQDVELVALKRDIEQLPLTRTAAPVAHASGKPSNNNATLIDIDVSSITEEKLVDVDASSSKTISPMEPVVLSALTSRVVSREASPIPVVQMAPSAPSVPVEPLVHLPVAVRPVSVQAPVAVPDEVESREEGGGEELVHVGYEDAVVVPNEAEEEEEEEEGVLVDVSPRPVDVEVSAVEVVDVDVEASQPEVVEVSAPEDVGVSAPEVVEVSFPKTTTDVLVDVPYLVDVHASPERTKPADLPHDQDTNTTSQHKPTAWQWDEEDDMMRAWSLGLDLVEAPLPLEVTNADVQVAGSPPLLPNDESLLDEKPPYDLLIQQEEEDPESPPTSIENSPPLPLLPPLTIPLITISDTKREQAEEEYPDPELLPLPDFSSTKEEKEKEKEKSRSPPSQTPTPPDSPPPSSPGVVKSRTAPSSPRIPPASPSSSSTLALRPAWSLRAADAPSLGLSSSSPSSSSTPVASPSLKKGGVALLNEEEGEEVVKVQKEEEADKIKLSEALPGSFPDSQAPSDTTATATTTPAAASIKTISAFIPPDTQRIRVSRSPLDIALAMQLRPGLGVGADPAWMVRFLMSMFGWFAILVSGQGEF